MERLKRTHSVLWRPKHMQIQPYKQGLRDLFLRLKRVSAGLLILILFDFHYDAVEQ